MKKLIIVLFMTLTLVGCSVGMTTEAKTSMDGMRTALISTSENASQVVGGMASLENRLQGLTNKLNEVADLKKSVDALKNELKELRKVIQEALGMDDKQKNFYI